MNADDLKRKEIAGAFAEGYAFYAWDPNTEQYEKITGMTISADGKRVMFHTDDTSD